MAVISVRVFRKFRAERRLRNKPVLLDDSESISSHQIILPKYDVY